MYLQYKTTFSKFLSISLKKKKKVYVHWSWESESIEIIQIKTIFVLFFHHILYARPSCYFTYIISFVPHNEVMTHICYPFLSIHGWWLVGHSITCPYSHGNPWILQILLFQKIVFTHDLTALKHNGSKSNCTGFMKVLIQSCAQACERICTWLVAMVCFKHVIDDLKFYYHGKLECYWW